MKLYKLPYDYENLTWQDIQEVASNHDVVVDHDDSSVTGTMEELASFFCDLDGPGQSFPIDEFKDWARSYEVDENGIPV